MADSDDKPNSIDRPHLFAHIYATHAAKVIEEYIATDNRDKISRVKIELDIIRVINEDPDLPTKHKVSCTSMILHTDTFEPFWGDQRLAYSLPAKSLKRLKSNYRLIDQLPCPPDDEESTAASAPENLTDKNGTSRQKSKAEGAAATNKGKGKRGPRAAPAKVTGKQTKKAATTAATRKRPTVAQKAPKTPKSTAGNRKRNTANGVEGASTTVPATAAPPPLRHAMTPREAYEACMAVKDGIHLRGPTSDEEETTTDDDDSDSD
ncbi:hypothetical protein TMatcc_003944 [Talaromyces marneffei ATCC 18224]|uniref:Uncharacterized protein n=1 Tax=Talaromyces marneffei (strain ATCC 18224 / CBS 334.59 / QM 7333) TaxID=441960 RepID=B6Q7K7_TALMQ|nr:uncharacterized protein EYB26_001070 [Talaromyces marneffei]EEA27759.1 hypothetical protein PMAA_026080 [Talaromyces marneffei ATCC 18224]KAE8556565.1 hypothetical protein EYB25_001266 [Talaromyces marneffei]QGA13420.1 hypothetical protein EYB26_001070 [Talaromyces marneffei]